MHSVLSGIVVFSPSTDTLSFLLPPPIPSDFTGPGTTSFIKFHLRVTSPSLQRQHVYHSVPLSHRKISHMLSHTFYTHLTPRELSFLFILPASISQNKYFRNDPLVCTFPIIPVCSRQLCPTPVRLPGPVGRWARGL